MTAAFDDNVTLAVEYAFGHGALDTTPVWTDVADEARAVMIRRGRTSVLGRFEAGTASITLDNTTGNFDPNNTQGAYYPNVKIGVPVRIRATHNAVTYTLFRGTVEAWPITFPDAGKNSVVTVPCVDGFKLLALFDLSDQSYSEESSDTRIGNVLDDVGWPAGERALSTGLADVQAFSGGESVAGLSHILDVADAEVGDFFVSSGGTATFQIRTEFSGGASSQASFGGTALAYHDVELAYDDDFLWNDVRVTREGGAEQRATDATSITNFGRRVLSKPGLPSSNDGEAFDTATWLLALYKEQQVRVRSLTIKPRSSPSDLWPQVLGRELRDAVTVTVTPPAGDDLTQEAVIEAVEHTFDASKNWTTRWTLHPLSGLEEMSFWEFDESVWNTSTVWA